MDSKKLHLVLTGLLVLLGIGLLVSAREANSLLESRSNTLANLKASDQATTVQKSQLAKDKRDIATYTDLNNIAKSVVPQDKDQAEAVRQIVKLASQSGISQLSSIAFPASTLGGTTTVKTPNGLTQVAPVKDIPGVYDLQITITQNNATPVPYNDFVTFLQKLENNRRTAQVSSISVQPQPNTNMVAFTLIIDEFIKP